MKCRPIRLTLFTLLALLALTACTVGPNYRRPDVAVPGGFKELDGWKVATPKAAKPKGDWWSVFHDPELDDLERQVSVSNQNVKQTEAAYREALALVPETQAGWFPTVGLSAGATRELPEGSVGTAGLKGASASTPTNDLFNANATASWDIDVWGRIRREVESQRAAAQVSAADLANATLSAQGSLATDYFELRSADSLTKLLADTVTAYERTLKITQDGYASGTASRGDVESAYVQLKTTQSQLIAVGVARAQYEHAIAVLMGRAPADLTIARKELNADVPEIPVGIPSALLERRPDIAGAERAVAEQNAQIGVAVAAFYPDISLSAGFGYVGNPLSSLISTANKVWSLGGAASETVFDGGSRRASVVAARAGYDQQIAAYRQTVLNAFQQVEDDLSSLRILERQAAVQDAAVAAARRAVAVTVNEYRAGTVAYTSVVTEQIQSLSNEEAALTIRQTRLVTAEALIQALGGGWQTRGYVSVARSHSGASTEEN